MNPLSFLKVGGVSFNSALEALNTSGNAKPYCDFVRFTAAIDQEAPRREVAKELFRAFNKEKDGQWLDKTEDVVPILREVVEAGFDLTWVDEKDRTLLHHAAQFGTPKKAETACRFLVSAGLDARAVDADGHTAFCYRAESRWCGFSALNDVLSRKMDIARHGLARTLIRGFESPDSLDLRTGLSPLHQLLMEPGGEPQPELLRDDLVALLLAEGANPNLRDPAGLTPLHLAHAGANLDQVKKLLVAGGADPTLRDRNGRLPEDLAALPQDERRRLLDPSPMAPVSLDAVDMDEYLAGDAPESPDDHEAEAEDLPLAAGGDAEPVSGKAPAAASNTPAPFSSGAMAPATVVSPVAPRRDSDEMSMTIGALTPPSLCEVPEVKQPTRALAAPGQAELF